MAIKSDECVATPEEWVAMPEDYEPEIIDPAIEFAELIVPDLQAT